MLKTVKLIFNTLLISLLIANLAVAQKKVKLKIPEAQTAMLLSKDDGSVTTSSTAGSLKLDISSGSTARIFLLDADTGKLSANVIASVFYKGKYYSYKEAVAKSICKQSAARAIYGVKVKGKQLSVGSVKKKDGFGYVTSKLKSSELDKSTRGSVSTKQCIPVATAASLGIATVQSQAMLKKSAIKINATSDDSDGDGLPDVLDVDEDNDGVLNPYDSNSTAPSVPSSGDVPSEFKLFSNIKPEIQSSLNAYTQTVTDTDITNLIKNVNLAIQVAGGNTLATELDCGSLNYCSSGGTGSVTGQPFPASFDSDSDGYGTITPGGTGDLQLTVNVTDKSQIGAGDILIQRVINAEGEEILVPGMLNFVFNSTPAISSLTMGSTTVSPVYPPSNNMLGSITNCFSAPSDWDQKLTISAYRPQRPGLEGEEELIDIGNSNISIDIPNLPCDATTNSAGCSGQNTKRCSVSSYTESDTFLESSGEGLKDTRSDLATNTTEAASNRITFTVDISTCISETWDVGEKLAIDLQFSNQFGDNAAQKFCIKR